jgi:hypothetical protein
VPDLSVTIKSVLTAVLISYYTQGRAGRELMKVPAMDIVPVLVIGPPVRPVPVATEVTVPDPPPPPPAAHVTVPEPLVCKVYPAAPSAFGRVY